MIDNVYLYREVDSMRNEKQVISEVAKNQTLNVLRSQLIDISDSTNSKRLKAYVEWNIKILDDCYKIDMYKFQFKLVSDMLQKEIKNLKEAVELYKWE